MKAMASLEATIAGAPEVVTHRLRRATKTGAWLTVQPSTVNGTELGAQEWRDAAFLRYGLDPLDLPNSTKAASRGSGGQVIVTCRDEATPLSVEALADGEPGVAAVAVFREFWWL